MSQPIPATRPCAAGCSRIELHPSRLAAAFGFAWLTAVCGVTWFAVDLPWLLRLAICGAVAAPGIRSLRSFVLLEGPRAVRAIEWSGQGELAVWLGPLRTRYPAELGTGSFRLGARLWVLRFVTPVGACPVLVAETFKHSRAFRRLTRHLNACLRRASGR